MVHNAHSRTLEVVLLLACSSAVAGPNLIRNAGFEEGPGTYTGVGKYWETNDALPHPAIDALTADTKHSGDWSQWLKASSEWDLGAVRQVSVYGSVTAGKTYRIEAWIKTANVSNPAGWYVFGVWWFHDDIYITDSKMPQQETTNYDWRLVSWNAVAPQYANRVAAVLTRHTNGDAWYDDIYIGEVTEGQPQIACNPQTFTHHTPQGKDVPDDVFAIQNVGGGTLNYTVSASAGWLSVSPVAGVGLGEVDQITISYSTASLTPGEYTASITTADPAASNSPCVVNVAVKVTFPGDFDLDDDVDQEDFGRFQTCYTGDGVAQTDPACANALLDSDDDVDSADFAIWQACFSSPGAEPQIDCATSQ